MTDGPEPNGAADPSPPPRTWGRHSCSDGYAPSLRFTPTGVGTATSHHISIDVVLVLKPPVQLTQIADEH